MALPSYYATDDTELESAVRNKTSYSDTSDEWPSSQATGNIEDAKRVLHMRTGSDKWYSDKGYNVALVALVAMKAKEAVENINIQSYGIADETLSFTNADPDSSQQIQSWSSEVNEGLNKSEVAFDKDPDISFSNTASYVG